MPGEEPTKARGERANSTRKGRGRYSSPGRCPLHRRAERQPKPRRGAGTIENPTGTSADRAAAVGEEAFPGTADGRPEKPAVEDRRVGGPARAPPPPAPGAVPPERGHAPSPRHGKTKRPESAVRRDGSLPERGARRPSQTSFDSGEFFSFSFFNQARHRQPRIRQARSNSLGLFAVTAGMQVTHIAQQR